MFLRKAALRPVPGYAAVDAHFIDSVEASLDEEEKLQERLDTGYRDLDRRQPTLSGWLSDELSTANDETVQSLGYFLIICVYLSFREAFPKRLREIEEGALRMAIDTLSVDEELRANDPLEPFESDDVIAMGQPSLISFVQHHVQEALEQSEGDINLDELDRVYRTVLVEIIALSHAVASPAGVLGPAKHALH